MGVCSDRIRKSEEAGGGLAETVHHVATKKTIREVALVRG
jgi:hypothetical protein